MNERCTCFGGRQCVGDTTLGFLVLPASRKGCAAEPQVQGRDHPLPGRPEAPVSSAHPRRCRPAVRHSYPCLPLDKPQTRPLGRLTAHTPATARRAGVSPSISAARGPVLSRQPEPGLGDPLGTPSPTHCGLPACLCGGRDPWSPVPGCLAPLWCSLWQDHEHRAICCFAHLISLGS